eukprot:2747637-Pyramimonas_sp.AAC.1
MSPEYPGFFHNRPPGPVFLSAFLGGRGVRFIKAFCWKPTFRGVRLIWAPFAHPISHHPYAP